MYNIERLIKNKLPGLFIEDGIIKVMCFNSKRECSILEVEDVVPIIILSEVIYNTFKYIELPSEHTNTELLQSKITELESKETYLEKLKYVLTYIRPANFYIPINKDNLTIKENV